jgi:serine/threonine-protein kinase
MATVTGVSDRLLRWQDARRQGKRLTAEELCADCPELAAELRGQIEALESMESLLGLGAAEHLPAELASQEALSDVPGYEVLGELGRGGMGAVFKARDVKLNRVVALKVLLAGSQAGALPLTRFKNEAELTARLAHPNIVPVYEVGEVSGRPFLAMEFLEGGALAERLAGNPLPVSAAAGLVLTLAEAVASAHGAGVIHRDLKPANVLLTRDGTPKIADFGLAKRLDAPHGPTQAGAVLGTPSYMAPEQADGRNRDVGPWTDVYALGAILYEALTGRPPFRGETTLETLEQVRTQEPVPPRRLRPKLPRDLEAVCLTCLEKDPKRRYPGAAELAEDLRSFLAGRPLTVRPVGSLGRAAKWARRQPAVAALAGACALALAAMALGGAWFTARLSEERDRARDQEHRAEAQRQVAEDERKAAQQARQEAEAQRARAQSLLRMACSAVDENAWRVAVIKQAPERDLQPGVILFNLARVNALAAADTANDRTLLPADRDRLADQYAARAVKLLDDARLLGYFREHNRIDRLRSDAELARLRDRPDYGEFLKRLER